MKGFDAFCWLTQSLVQKEKKPLCGASRQFLSSHLSYPNMNHEHPARWAEKELLAQCRLTFSRASGPGGQNRNKVETSVQIEFIPARHHRISKRTKNANRKPKGCYYEIALQASGGISRFGHWRL